MKLRPFTARAAITFVAVVLLGGIVLAEQKPGDCGYYVNSNGHRVPSPCGNSRADPPPPRATAKSRGSDAADAGRGDELSFRSRGGGRAGELGLSLTPAKRAARCAPSCERASDV